MNNYIADLLTVDWAADGVAASPRRQLVDFKSSGGVRVSVVDNPNTEPKRKEVRFSATLTLRARVATTTALPAHTRSGNVLTASANGAFPAVDGVTLSQNQTILVRAEAPSHLEHGLYYLTQVGNAGLPWQLTRVPEFDSSDEAYFGLRVYVAEGATHAGTEWMLSTVGTIVLNSDPITFTRSTGNLQTAANPGDDGKIVYAQSGGYSLASGVKIGASGTAIDFGAQPSTDAASAIRWSSGSRITARRPDNTGNAVVLWWNPDSTVRLGDDSNPAGMHYRIGSGTHRWFVAGSEILQVSSSQLILLDGVNLRVGQTNVASVGDVRVRNEFTLYGRDAANATNHRLLWWNNADRLDIGAVGLTGGMRFEIATGGSFSFRVNNVVKFSTSGSATHVYDNSLIFGNSAYATTGTVRGASGFTLNVRNFADNANIGAIQVNSSDYVIVGDDANAARTNLRAGAGGRHEFYISGTSELMLDSGGLYLRDNAIIFGLSAFATGALLNTTHGVTLLAARDNANAANIGLLFWGVSGTNVFTLGSSTLPNTHFNVATGGAWTWNVNGVAEMVLTSALLDLKDNSLAFGAAPSTAGLVRVPHNTTVLSGRNSGDSGNITLLRWGEAADSLGLGSPASGSISILSPSLGFYAAAPIAKPAVSGSRGGNAALASLCTALANLGLITNSTS